MLELLLVSKYYPPWDRNAPALRNVSLTIGPGEIVGVFGNNGAGKSTLMRCLAGVIQPTDGSVLLDGQKKGISRKVTLSEVEGSYFPSRTISEHRLYFKSLQSDFDPERFDKLIHFFKLNMKDKPRSLSTGNRSRFELALTLARKVPYILLDEPMLGHDPDTRRDLLRLLPGWVDDTQTIVLSTHLVQDVEPLLSRVLFLQKGQLISDQSLEQVQETDGSLIEHLRRVGGYDPERAMRFLENQE